MGLVKVIGSIGTDQDHLQEVEFLVDTGSAYTLVPHDLARQLGITPTHKSRVVVADSRTLELDVAAASLELMDREGVVLVRIMDVPMPLLGAFALQTLGLKVDPARETLEHSRPFGPAAL